MPPKCIFTKEEIIRTALQLVRTEGMDALTARSLAQALGTSTKPIFGLFASMQALQTAVLSAADVIYQQYLLDSMQGGKYPPYKASGMGYIQFAMEEKKLFKLLFMRDRSGETIAEDRESIRPLLDLLQNNLHISEDRAYLFHLEMWLYVHGIATMLATGYLDWDMAFVSSALTDAYLGLCARFREEC